eukprot:TRINITY_DN377_c0_g1_i2.p1 TRINITY_DN377_c0_g1~~TRINITY_DN377_c0_g1_i2.p1  ORF type:complete len:480 (+),score=170.67 TRINITY_DN377_c0_g1_i2:47-1486(+)
MMKAVLVLGLLAAAEGTFTSHWDHWGHHHGWNWWNRNRNPPSRRPTKYDFTTKTPYWSSKSLSNHEHEGPVGEGDERCEAVHLQHVGRHGSRYDDNDDVKDLEELLASKGSAIKNPRYAFLKSWTNPFPTNVEKHLNEVGKEELYKMGARYRRKYGRDILSEDYNPIYHTFQHTWKTRTSRSASAFALSSFQEGRGQLGRDNNEPVAMFCLWNGLEDYDGDKIIRFSDNCPNYDAITDDDNFPGKVQEDIFEKKLEEEVGARVTAKLQLDTSVWKLDFDGLELLYKACMFETVVLDTPRRHSPCAVFEEKDYEMFAFLKDLGEYYEGGHGTQIAQELACPLMSKLLNGLKKYSEDDNEVQAAFMFGHSDTIQPLLAQLGLYVDPVPLTADMPWEQAMARKWRTGVISPMAANVDMVLHRCENAEGVTSWKTELLHNERRIRWPKCGADKTNVQFCSPDDLFTAYPMAGDCKYDEFCKIP